MFTNQILQRSQAPFFHVLNGLFVHIFSIAGQILPNRRHAVVFSQIVDTHIHAAMETGVKILIIGRTAVHDHGILINDHLALKDLGIVNQNGTGGMIHG